MASINKLMIQGIRSYDPDKSTVIKFNKPLTIIVGQNGAGKTTIIEALKYATTGVFPPNSKNGGFIHDPKLANKKEVSATIRLQFESINNEIMECNRGIVATRNKTTSIKTVETILTNHSDPSGEVTRTALRTGGMDEAMLNLLGTNKSVLENVIFCHQEESNWPLSESSVLKKKFDAIFSSFKYTKALEELKDIKKISKAENDVLEVSLQSLKYKNEKSQEISEKLEKRKEEIEEGENRIEELTQEISRSEEAIERINGILNELKSAFTAKSISENERDTLIHDREENRNQLINSNLTLDELNAMRDTHQKKLHSKDRDHQKYNENFDTLKNEINEQQVALKILVVEQAKLQSEREIYERKVKESYSFIESIKKVLTDLDLESNSEQESDSDDDSLHDTDFEHIKASTKRRLDLKVEGLKQTIHDSKEGGKSEESKLNDEVRICENEIDKIQSKLNELKVNRKENKFSFDQTLQKYNEYSEHSSRIESMDALIREQETLLEQAKVDFEREDFDAKIQANRRSNTALQTKIFAKMEASDRSEARDATYILRKAKEDERRQISTEFDGLANKHKIKFTKLLGTIHSPDTWEEALKDSIQAKHARIQEIKVEATSINNKIGHIDQSDRNSESQLQMLNNKLLELESSIELPSANGLFEDVYNEAQASLISINSELSILKCKRQMYNELFSSTEKATISKLKSCNKCSKQDGSKALFTTLGVFYETYQNLNHSQTELEKNLKETTTACQSLLKLAPDWGALDRIKFQQIPELEKVLQSNRNAKERYNSQLNDLNLEGNTSENELRELEALTPISRKVNSLHRQIQKLKTELDALPKLAQPEEDQIVSTVTELNEEQKTLNHQHRTLSKNKEVHQTNISQLENRVLELKTLKINVQSEQQELKQLEAQLTSFTAQKEKIDTEIKNLKECLEVLRPAVTEKGSELKALVATREAFEQKIQKNLTTLQGLQNQFVGLQDELDRFDTSASNFKLSEVGKQILQVEAKVAEMFGQQDSIKLSIDELQNQAHQSRTIIEEVNQACKFYKLDFQVEQVEKEIAVKLEFIESYGYNEDTIQANLIDLTTSLKTRQSECDQLKGSVKSWKMEVDNWQQELETQFENIQAEYLSKFYETELNKMALEDATFYAKSLERSIMRYHMLKMDEINEIIQELWMNTYNGTDIDTIRIVSDLENATNRSSFTYKMVMIKGNTELDMRGRCSAGQKVLASIIVRLALADAFGDNCGILALDEPTTNLDKDNITKLAEALSEVIALRRHQKNFQLLIITHDKNFTNLLSRAKYTNSYYVVTKADNGCSEITKQNISNLF